LEELDIFESIILKWIFKKQGGKVWWTGFILLRTVVGVGVMWTEWWMQEISWLVELPQSAAWVSVMCVKVLILAVCRYADARWYCMGR